MLVALFLVLLLSYTPQKHDKFQRSTMRLFVFCESLSNGRALLNYNLTTNDCVAFLMYLTKRKGQLLGSNTT